MNLNIHTSSQYSQRTQAILDSAIEQIAAANFFRDCAKIVASIEEDHTKQARKETEEIIEDLAIVTSLWREEKARCRELEQQLQETRGLLAKSHGQKGDGDGTC